MASLHKSYLRGRVCSLYDVEVNVKAGVDIFSINLKTAFLCRDRFLMTQSGQNHDKLSGIIEVDEFFLAYLKKGSNKLTHQNKARERGGNIDKRTKEGLVAIFLSIDRSNHMINLLLSADTKAKIAANLTKKITESSVLCSDDSWSYVTTAKQNNCDHKRLISNKARVIDKV